MTYIYSDNLSISIYLSIIYTCCPDVEDNSIGVVDDDRMITLEEFQMPRFVREGSVSHLPYVH